MVYIPYARQDLNNHADLAAWRMKTKAENDWTNLKEFLSEQPRLIDDIHTTPKCWYTELLQGDNYALDVEHFRPKNSGNLLKKEQLKRIQDLMGLPVLQELVNGSYPWLEFDYRNYRLTSALPNRAGAKHIYFPILQSTNRIQNNESPWLTQEYNLMLDPTDKHDSNLLLVLPNGAIIPKAPKTNISKQDIINLPNTWHSSGFDYMRAWVTIVMYRLDERILEKGREEKYKATVDVIDELAICIEHGYSKMIEPQLKRLFESLLPSAPFALAARSAVAAYSVEVGKSEDLKRSIERMLHMVQSRLDNLIDECEISWDNK